jgi:hypothetical protein
MDKILHIVKLFILSGLIIGLGLMFDNPYSTQYKCGEYIVTFFGSFLICYYLLSFVRYINSAC